MSSDLIKQVLSQSPCYPVGGWRTSASAIPPQSIGEFHIVKKKIPAGSILKCKAFSYDTCVFVEDTTITVLREGERDKNDTESVWMSDTPQEYFKCCELVARAEGPNVLVGGLGLGLMTHLLSIRRDVKKIVAVENAKPVIQMVKPYLLGNVQVKHGDFIKAIRQFSEKGKEFDTIIADIWKSNGEKDKEIMEECKMVMEDHYMNATHLFWGFQVEVDNEYSLFALLSRKNKKKT